MMSSGEVRDEVETPSKRLNLISTLDMIKEIQGENKVTRFNDQEESSGPLRRARSQDSKEANQLIEGNDLASDTAFRCCQ